MTLTVAAAQDPYWLPPRVRLDVDSSTSLPKPVPAGSVVRVDRIHQDGQRFPVILEANARLGSGSWAGFDYCCPFSQPVRYVAVIAGQESSLSPVDAWLPSDKTWLTHPTEPALSFQPLRIVSIGARTARSASKTFDVYGSAYPVSLSSGARRALSGDITIALRAEDEHLAADLLEDSGPILINTPATAGWDLKWAWIQPGDVVYSNPGGYATYRERLASFSYQVVAQPDTDITPEWTWAKVMATFPNFGAVRDDYVNGEALKLDSRT